MRVLCGLLVISFFACQQSWSRRTSRIANQFEARQAEKLRAEKGTRGPARPSPALIQLRNSFSGSQLSPALINISFLSALGSSCPPLRSSHLVSTRPAIIPRSTLDPSRLDHLARLGRDLHLWRAKHRRPDDDQATTH